MAGARTKGINLSGLSGFNTAREIEAESRASSERALYQVGSGGRRLFDTRREERHRAEAKAERTADDVESRRRFDAEFGLRKGEIERSAQVQRDQGAASYFSKLHEEAIGDLKTIMGERAANPMLGENAGWKSAFQQAQERERDLAGKLGQVRSRLSGQPAESMTAPAPVVATYDIGGATVKADLATPEGQIAAARSTLEQVQARRAKAKSAGEATLWAAREGQAQAHLNLLEEGRRDNKKKAADKVKAEKDHRQGLANAEYFAEQMQRPEYADVSNEDRGAILHLVRTNQMKPGDALRRLETMRQRTPGALAATATMKGEARAAGKEAEAGALGVRTPKQKQDVADQEKAARAEQRKERIAAAGTRDRVAAQTAAFNEIEDEWRANGWRAEGADFSFADPGDIQAFVSRRNPQGKLREALQKALPPGFTLGGQAAPSQPSGADPKAEAAAEFKALAPGEQTAERWAEIKKRRGL